MNKYERYQTIKQATHATRRMTGPEAIEYYREHMQGPAYPYVDEFILWVRKRLNEGCTKFVYDPRKMTWMALSYGC